MKELELVKSKIDENKHSSYDRNVKKLQYCEKLKRVMEIEKLNLINDFWKQSDLLYKDLRRESFEFHGADLQSNAKIYLQQQKQCKKDINQLQQELNVINKRTEGLFQPFDKIDLEEVTLIIEQESCVFLGEPLKIKKRLSNIRLMNEIFMKKIQSYVFK